MVELKTAKGVLPQRDPDDPCPIASHFRTEPHSKPTNKNRLNPFQNILKDSAAGKRFFERAEQQPGPPWAKWGTGLSPREIA